MKFGSIWQRLRSSFANSAGTIVFGMEDSAKTVLIAGPPVPSPPPVAAVPVRHQVLQTCLHLHRLLQACLCSRAPVSAQIGDGFHGLAWTYSSVTEDARHARSRDCGARPKP